MARYRDREWLEVMYHGREHTQAEIAACCDVSPRTIRKYMDEHGIPTREVSGRNHGLYGRERDGGTREKIAETLEGREYEDAWRERLAEAKRGSEVSEETRKKISESLTGIERSWETRERMSESTKGEANPMWKGGHTDDYGPGWRPARRRVRDRDKVCQKCGHDGSESQLEVHHIVPVRLFDRSDVTDISEAHDLSNLLLLCFDCHRVEEHEESTFESGIEPPPDVEWPEGEAKR